jgi:hypothetical protein
MEEVPDPGRDTAAALEEEEDSYAAPSQSSLGPQTDPLDLGISADVNFLPQLDDLIPRELSQATDAEVDGVSQITLCLCQGITELDQRKRQLDEREIDIVKREAQQKRHVLLDGLKQEGRLKKLAQLNATRNAFVDECSRAKEALDHYMAEYEIRRQNLCREEFALIRRQQTVLARETALDNQDKSLEAIKRFNENIRRAMRRMQELVATEPREITSPVELCLQYIFAELGRDGNRDFGFAVSKTTVNSEGKARSDGDTDLHLSTPSVQYDVCGAQGRYGLDVNDDVPVDGAHLFNDNQSGKHNRSDSRTRGTPVREQQYRSLEHDLRRELVELREAVPDDEICAWRMKLRIENIKMKLNAGTEDCGYADRFETDVSDAKADDMFDYNCLTEARFNSVKQVIKDTNCSPAEARGLLFLADWNVKVRSGSASRGQALPPD